MREKQFFLSQPYKGASAEEKVANAKLSAIKEIKTTANQLTHYKRYRAVKPDMGEVAHQKALSKEAARAHPSRDVFSNLSKGEQQQFKDNADLLSISYQGVGSPPNYYELPEGYRLVADSELPPALSMFYNGRTGIFNTPDGCKALLIQNDDQVKVVFAGTEPGPFKTSDRTGTVSADVVQRLGGYVAMYHRAAGIAQLLLVQPQMKEKSVQFVGHSLGGGMAQYALATNIHPNDERLTAMTYNSAGLSAATLESIGPERIALAQSRVRNTRLEGDPVSPGSDKGEFFKGQILGKMWTIKQENVGAVSLSAHLVSSLSAAINSRVSGE